MSRAEWVSREGAKGFEGSEYGNRKSELGGTTSRAKDALLRGIAANAVSALLTLIAS